MGVKLSDPLFLCKYKLLNKRNKVIITAMPQKSNKQADLSAVMSDSSVFDMDNVYWSNQGWAYRHYKTAAKSNAAGGFWDEILVAGEALLANGNPDATAADFALTSKGAATPTFETGDGEQGAPIATGPIEGYVSLDTSVAFGADLDGAAATLSGAATGTVDTDEDGNVTVVNITAGGDYEIGDEVTVSEDGGSGAATFTVAEIG